MKIHDVAQCSVDWEILRAGKITASEMDALITPAGKVRTGEGVKTYLTKKVAERWLGGPLPSANFWDGEQGQFLEEIAKPAFTLQTGREIRNVGFITTDDDQVGCSPDGLLDEDTGLEIKCPHVETHIRYLLDHRLPLDYVAQVQGSMFVTGYSKWIVCSFRRNFPLFSFAVYRDAEFQDELAEAIESFQGSLAEAMSELTRLNGGPPKHKASYYPPLPNLKPITTQLVDIIP